MENGFSQEKKLIAGALAGASSKDLSNREKTCHVCHQTKPLAAFSLDKYKSDGRHGRCKICRKAHYDANKEQVAQACKDYYAIHKQRHGELSRAYYHANKNDRSEKMAAWYQTNKLEVSERQSQYRKENLPKIAAKQARRRAAEYQATPKWANKDLILKFYVEAARMSTEMDVIYHVDHIVPLLGKTVCGLHNEFNLQVIPGEENLSKSNRYWPNMPI